MAILLQENLWVLAVELVLVGAGCSESMPGWRPSRGQSIGMSWQSPLSGNALQEQLLPPGCLPCGTETSLSLEVAAGFGITFSDPNNRILSTCKATCLWNRLSNTQVTKTVEILNLLALVGTENLHEEKGRTAKLYQATFFISCLPQLVSEADFP